MLRRRGQTSLEYTVLVIIVIGVFIAIGSYFKRGVQGRWKAAVDDLGDQYDPRVMNTDVTYRVDGTTTTILTVTPKVDGYWTTRQDTSTSSETKTGYMRTNSY